MPRRALVLTVGTGDVANPEATLLAPLRKSIRKGEWSRIVLLPSHLTRQRALGLKEEFAALPIDVRPLPRDGDENNADACFAHFDEVIGELRADFPASEAIVVDYTRGTKAMSAALVLAAVRHDVARLRYIWSRKRDERGSVVPGTEEVDEFPTTQLGARRRLEEARRLLERGAFAAVLKVLPAGDSPWAGLDSADLVSAAARVRPFAQFYAAWDNLDHEAAHKTALPLEAPPADWARFRPTEAMRQWVRLLAQPAPSRSGPRMERFRQVAAELIANGERRVRDRQYEDAFLRAYRVAEIIAKMRLLARGLDSENLNRSHAVVKPFLSRLRNINGRLAASREQMVQMLAEMKDSAADGLRRLGALRERNESILVHGLEPVSGSREAPLRDTFRKLEDILRSCGGAPVEQELATARLLSFES